MRQNCGQMQCLWLFNRTNKLKNELKTPNNSLQWTTPAPYSVMPLAGRLGTSVKNGVKSIMMVSVK